MTSLIKSSAFKIILIIVILFIAFFFGVGFGSVNIPINEFFKALFTGQGTYGTIVVNLRLPRVIACLLTGIALSVAGLLLQRITNNDLASPNLIGINSGAGLGVMIVLCFLPYKSYFVSLFAFIGSLLTAIIVIGISSKVRSNLTSVTLILAGVALGSLLSAIISFLSQLHPEAVTSYIGFQTGSFASIRWNDLIIPSSIIIVCLILSLLMCGRLNLLILGDDIARSLGVNVKATKYICLILATLLTASSVSYCGLIGFIGLMVPHIARRIIGNDNRILMPISAMIGSILVIFSDLIGRTCFGASEISAGIILAFIGAPFFIYLLFKKGKRYEH